MLSKLTIKVQQKYGNFSRFLSVRPIDAFRPLHPNRGQIRRIIQFCIFFFVCFCLFCCLFVVCCLFFLWRDVWRRMYSCVYQATVFVRSMHVEVLVMVGGV